MAVKTEEIIARLNDKPKVIVSDEDKFNHKFVVEPAPGGFIFYEVRVTAGNLPAELSGYYSTMKQGVAAVVRYIEHAQPSKTKQRDKRAEAREQEKARA